MTERFVLVTPSWDDDYSFIADNGKHIPLDEVVNILNNQDEQIKLLERILLDLGYRIEIR